MAELATEVIVDSVRNWLARDHENLNGRFRRAQRRFPALDPDATLALCREILPRFHETRGEAGSQLLSMIYDLILLHSGRGTLTAGGNSGIGVLLHDSFPLLKPLLLQRPRQLPGALSNAVENLGEQGINFARQLPALASQVKRVDELLDAGAVLAWRLGLARLRQAAFSAAVRLPPRALLEALELPGWPVDSASLVIAGLTTSAWYQPQELLSQETRARLPAMTPAERAKLCQEISQPSVTPLKTWELVGRLGDFLGFGGNFDRPPLLLDVPQQTDPHRFRVRCGETAFLLEGDVFGWACQVEPSADFPPAKGRRPRGLELPHETTSFVVRHCAIAYTTKNSFRIRVLAPRRGPI